MSSSSSNITELNPRAIEAAPEENCRRKSSTSSHISFRRLFRRDSIITNSRYTYQLYPPSNYDYSLCGKEFLLKIAQILISTICVGLFADGIQHNLKYSITSMLFPNVVYSSSMINTSIIALGYLLGQVMPEILIRIFNSVALVLFLVSTCINISTYISVLNGDVTVLNGDVTDLNGYVTDSPEEDNETGYLLLAQILVSSSNVILYGVDLAIGIRRSLKGEN